MRITKTGALLLLAALGFCNAVSANGVCNEKLVVFGDSLSDTGNVYTIRQGVFPPSPPYSSGRFTEDLSGGGLPIPPGQVWIEYLADLLQLDRPRARFLPPVGPASTNYAFGGAVTGDEPAFFSPALNDQTTLGGTPPLDAQVNLFGQDLAAAPAQGCARELGNSLFVIWIGANDLLLGSDKPPAQWVKSIQANIERLIAAGATKFLIPNLPNLASIPGVQGEYDSLFIASGISEVPLSELKKRVVKFNEKLSETLDKLQAKNPGIRISRLDVFALVSDVIDNPAAYGFDANTAIPLLDEQALFINQTPPFLRINAHPAPPAALFWDGVHPTSRAHAVIAAEACRVLERPGTSCEFAAQ